MRRIRDASITKTPWTRFQARAATVAYPGQTILDLDNLVVKPEEIPTNEPAFLGIDNFVQKPHGFPTNEPAFWGIDNIVQEPDVLPSNEPAFLGIDNFVQKPDVFPTSQERHNNVATPISGRKRLFLGRDEGNEHVVGERNFAQSDGGNPPMMMSSNEVGLLGELNKKNQRFLEKACDQIKLFAEMEKQKRESRKKFDRVKLLAKFNINKDTEGYADALIRLKSFLKPNSKAVKLSNVSCPKVQQKQQEEDPESDKHLVGERNFAQSDGGIPPMNKDANDKQKFLDKTSDQIKVLEEMKKQLETQCVSKFDLQSILKKFHIHEGTDDYGYNYGRLRRVIKKYNIKSEKQSDVLEKVNGDLQEAEQKERAPKSDEHLVGERNFAQSDGGIPPMIKFVNAAKNEQKFLGKTSDEIKVLEEMKKQLETDRPFVFKNGFVLNKILEKCKIYKNTDSEGYNKAKNRLKHFIEKYSIKSAKKQSDVLEKVNGHLQKAEQKERAPKK